MQKNSWSQPWCCFTFSCHVCINYCVLICRQATVYNGPLIGVSNALEYSQALDDSMDLWQIHQKGQFRVMFLVIVVCSSIMRQIICVRKCTHLVRFSYHEMSIIDSVDVHKTFQGSTFKTLTFLQVKFVNDNEN